MFRCQSPFSLVQGADKRINDDAIQGVMQMGNPGQGAIFATESQ